MATLASVRVQVATVPPWAWFGLAAVGGLGLLIWHEWANTRHPDDSWLDPEQPLPMVEATTERADRPKQRPYPASLMSWGCSRVGDC